MNLNLQKGLLTELAKQADVNTKLEELAIRHGVNTNGGLVNTLAALERKLADLEEAEQKVRELGYKSLNAALYGLSKQNRYPNVPADLQVVPDHWVKEKTWKRVEVRPWEFKTVVDPAVTATQARQKLNKLLPYLNELLHGADADFMNQVRTEQSDPKVTFENFSFNVHSCLAEDAGFGQTWDTTALPPAETTTELPAVEFSEDKEALATLAYLQTVKPDYGTPD